MKTLIYLLIFFDLTQLSIARGNAYYREWHSTQARHSELVSIICASPTVEIAVKVIDKVLAQNDYRSKDPRVIKENHRFRVQLLDARSKLLHGACADSDEMTIENCLKGLLLYNNE